MIPVQILLNHKLSKEENLWLHSLTNTLDNVITIQDLLSDYEKNQENTLYQAMLEIIVKSNKEKFEEVMHMCTCNALLEIMKDDLDERERQGEEKGEIRINNLNQKLIALDRLGDLIKSVSDPIFQKELFKEFDL